MLKDYEEGLLKAHKINPEDVESVDTQEMWVTFKDGTKRRICECWTRVMGYIRPTTEFNVGKRSEFESRKYFTEEKTLKHINDTNDINNTNDTEDTKEK